MARPARESSDVLIVGAGAAGLLAALAARGAIDGRGARRDPDSVSPAVTAIDASSKLGLKILVSGGGRCNVTNARVTEEDFDSDAPQVLRAALRAFPPESVRAFFEARGVPLGEEPMGKLFPRSGRARDVLDALLDAAREAGVRIETGADVVELARRDGGWTASCADGRSFDAPRFVLATGGRSLPKTGSRGFGLDAARGLGHSIATELPALTALLLRPDAPIAGIPGITHPALLTLAPRGLPWDRIASARFRPLARSAGSLLVTHRGASGPAALDVSGACALALHEGREVELVADFWALTRDASEHAALFRAARPPGACVPPDLAPRPTSLPELLSDVAALGAAGRATVATVLSRRMPRSLVDALLRTAGVDPARPARLLGQRGWRDVHLAVCRCDLRLAGVEGYARAEVTRGGVLLGELDPATFESRLHPGLYLCGEMLHCTGRLGGFNFQWAWSSGFVTGTGAGSRSGVSAR